MVHQTANTTVINYMHAMRSKKLFHMLHQLENRNVSSNSMTLVTVSFSIVNFNTQMFLMH